MAIDMIEQNESARFDEVGQFLGSYNVFIRKCSQNGKKYEVHFVNEQSLMKMVNAT